MPTSVESLGYRQWSIKAHVCVHISWVVEVHTSVLWSVARLSCCHYVSVFAFVVSCVRIFSHLACLLTFEEILVNVEERVLRWKVPLQEERGSVDGRSR